MNNKFICSVVAFAFVAGCSSGPKTDSAGHKHFASTTDSSSGFRLRPYEEKKLANGLQLLLVKDTSLPYVSYDMMIRSGSTSDQGSPGLSAMVAELLDKGSKDKTATQTADALAALAAEFDRSVAHDYTLLATSSLSGDASEVFDIYFKIVTTPAFKTEEIERLRKQFVADAKNREDSPEAFSELAWAQYLYGSHPYAQNTTGTLKSLQAITKKQIIQHYLRYYHPNNITFALIGNYTPELESKVEAALTAWPARDVSKTNFPELAKIEGQKALIVDKAGLVQAQIRLGNFGIKRNNDDFVALRIANTILGGAFSSRLVDRVRKELGLTYSISSAFDARMDSGPFEIETFTKVSSVGQTVGETLGVLRKFRDSGVSSNEVSMAKGYLKGVFPSAIETAEKFAHNLMVLRLYGINDDYLSGYLRKVDGTSTDEVNRVIRKYFDAQNIKVLVYGPADEIKPQLKDFTNVEVKPAQDFE